MKTELKERIKLCLEDLIFVARNVEEVNPILGDIAEELLKELSRKRGRQPGTKYPRKKTLMEFSNHRELGKFFSIHSE